MESRHCGQDKRIFFCPVHNASTPCSLQAFGIRCIMTNHKCRNCSLGKLDKKTFIKTHVDFEPVQNVDRIIDLNQSMTVLLISFKYM